MGSTFSTKSLIVFGISVLMVSVVGFLTWAVNVPLSSASIASGSVVVESKRKQIQHLQGGWIKEVFVKEGDLVEVGQPLMELTDSRAEADYRRFLYRHYSLLAQESRLDALQSQSPEIKWAEGLSREQDIFTIRPIQDSEKVQFQQALLQMQLIDSQYKQQVSLYEEKIKGNGFQKKAIRSQLDLVRQEVDMTKGLVAKGYVSKTRMLELQRHNARIEAELAEITVVIDVAKRELNTLHQSYLSQVLDLKSGYSQQLKTVKEELRDIHELMKAAEDVRSHILMKSEYAGRVVGLNVSSVGGVVRPGQTLMEIVPVQDELIVEAIVPPKDIDVVRQGQEARIRLTAYSSRRVPPVLGTVTHISADRVIQGDGNEQSDQGYLVRVKFDQEALASIQGVELYPGMLTEVLILIEERTLWDYLIGPLSDGLSRAMRES
ncbi:HlyD family type I secretion periplasmic adaptor subunit [Vibrio makurazakiensis]|uniref:HlyD family type I secretion periplasmic adaptor subunit n=1 Tax=Vibrio makurazakiensis TaxID=2910250 RepID=UPI003D0E9C11